MLYMVECDFSDPAQLDAWNAWYSGPKLDSLLALSAWRSSQRFRAAGPCRAPWLAIHAVSGPAVFTSEEYKSSGGGNFSDWGPLISNWSRNLFAGLEVGPEVPEGALLALADVSPDGAPLPDIAFTWLRGAGLDNTVPNRAIAVLDQAPKVLPAGMRLYRPWTPYRTGRGWPA